MEHRQLYQECTYTQATPWMIQGTYSARSPPPLGWDIQAYILYFNTELWYTGKEINGGGVE